MTDAKAPKPRKIKPPRGTRDLYPAEAARRRWLMERWREVSIRHGFEEVDGPVFEQADLYAVKSGEGILGELFQAFSGKSPEEVERVKRDGRAGYALRPEFTPTLARMYAAKANTLPKPCKWFMAGPFFRAERPQRGRLREFLQWNVDVLGLDVPLEKWYAEDAESRAEVAKAKARMDAECIACCVAFLEACGLDAESVSIRVNDRQQVEEWLRSQGIQPARIPASLSLIDRVDKISPEIFQKEAVALGFSDLSIKLIFARTGFTTPLNAESASSLQHTEGMEPAISPGLVCLGRSLEEASVSGGYCVWDSSIVRGLAYYTGTVFEVIADGERAVAGGGRYDNLIELFGGPPTPAVGFAMGDVVLSLLLQEKGLMPSDEELLGLVGQHPDVFVLSNGTAEAEAKVRPVVAMLRRGPDGRDARPTGAIRGLHVRHSYKTTKKIDKLLAEAKKQHARFAVIIEDAESCTIKDLRADTQWPNRVALDELYKELSKTI